MRGPDEQTQHTFTYLSPEQRVPADHPLRAICALTDEALRSMSAQLEKLLFRRRVGHRSLRSSCRAH